MNQHPVLLPGPRLLSFYTEKMVQITTTTDDISPKSYINRCLGILKHLQYLQLSEDLIFIAVWKGSQTILYTSL